MKAIAPHFHRFTLALKGDRSIKFRRKNRAGSDRTLHPEHHQFQLWAYSQATAKPNAHIAYLRHDRLHTFTPAQLSKLTASASTLVDGLVKGDFTPTPAETSCGICPYTEVCEEFSKSIEQTA